MADKKISALTGASTPLAGTEVLPIVQSGTTVKVSVANLTAGRPMSASSVNISGLTASTALALNASKEVVSVTNTGTGDNVLATSPTLVTPILGVASATSLNKVALTTPATNATLTIAEGKTLTVSNSLTIAGTDATTMTFPATSATLARTDAANSFTGDQTLSTGNLVIGTSGKGIDFSATPNTGTSELLADYEEGDFTPGLTVASGSLTYAVQGTPKYTKVGRLVNASGYINVSVANLPSGALTITGLPYASTVFAAVTLTFFTGGFISTYSGYLSPSGTSITIPNLNANIMVGGENIIFSATYSAA